MMEFYHDFYGAHACIRTFRTGAARLTIRLGSGKLVKSGDYLNRSGALRAMRNFSEGWHKIDPV